MQKTLSRSLLIALAVSAATATCAHARPTAQTATQQANEAATARHYAALIAGAAPKTAELTLFFSQMPKGGDLHHHYSGALYAETYVNWLDKQGWCVDKTSYRIVTDKDKVALEKAKPPAERACLSTAEVYADDHTWRELLQRWAVKDFHNHTEIQAPPDRQFFQTFLYFDPVASTNYHEGLLEIKNRAVKENVGYIETIFQMSPFVVNPQFDSAAWQNVHDDAALDAQMRAWMQALDQDPKFNAAVAAFIAGIDQAAQGIDDEQFTMRYQTYVLRLFNPSMVFSSMLSGFKAAAKDGKIVGVNIVGQESQRVPMRDYLLHMKMFRFLKTIYPNVKIDLHAGELALGDVPPEDLQYHIDQAVNIAGANRIGHGIDLAHESNAAAIMKTMRDKGIAVEINLTSNDFIEGIRDENHPITLYRRYGVPYVISTDDAGVTRHNLSNEYTLFASRYKPSYAELKKASYDSIRYSFLPNADKTRLTRQLDTRFATFEAGIVALDRTTMKH